MTAGPPVQPETRSPAIIMTTSMTGAYRPTPCTPSYPYTLAGVFCPAHQLNSWKMNSLHIRVSAGNCIRHCAKVTMTSGIAKGTKAPGT